MPKTGSLVSEQARHSAALVSLLLSSLLAALLGSAAGAATPPPPAPATVNGLVSFAANPATPAEIATASLEADEHGTGTGDPPAATSTDEEALLAFGAAADSAPLEARIGAGLSSGHGFSARAPPSA